MFAPTGTTMTRSTREDGRRAAAATAAHHRAPAVAKRLTRGLEDKEGSSSSVTIMMTTEAPMKTASLSTECLYLLRRWVVCHQVWEWALAWEWACRLVWAGHLLRLQAGADLWDLRVACPHLRAVSAHRLLLAGFDLPWAGHLRRHLLLPVVNLSSSRLIDS